MKKANQFFTVIILSAYAAFCIGFIVEACKHIQADYVLIHHHHIGHHSNQ